MDKNRGKNAHPVVEIRQPRSFFTKSGVISRSESNFHCRAQKVIMAMSGGVDSSVAAALLKRAGFAFPQGQGNPERSRRVDVVGVFMRLYDSSRFRDSEKRARKIAKILKIPFLSLDLRKEFKKRIIDYFLSEYKKGQTPNPCVVCNKEIKFGLLLEKALALDADFVATGHYARKQETGDRKQGTRYKLLRGRDKNKDQSYFLWMLNQKQLRKILFPVGNYTKDETKELAKKLKLPVFKIPESQEICFIPKSINDFLKKHLKLKTGKIVNTEEKIIGQHQGLWFYTIGQRKGIGLSGGPAFVKASAGKPYYVLDKDLKKNLLIVTNNEKDLYKKELIAKNVNWIRAPSSRSVLDRAQKICALVSGKEPKLPLKVMAKIRYRHKLSSATIYKLKTKNYKLVFNQPQRAITPGQSVVFYQNNEVLGGGIIIDLKIRIY